MFNSSKIDLQSIATAAIGALMLSTACIAAAIAPARAAETGPVLVAQAQLSDEAHA